MKTSLGTGFVLGLVLIVAVSTTTNRGTAQPASARPAPGQPETSRLPEAGTKTDNPQLLELDHRIKALREDLRSQLDPLEAQVKGLHEKYDAQIKDLVQQRKTLVEQGKPSAIQQLDVQEDGELATLADREKAEIEKVKESFAEQRKEVQRRYDDQRKGIAGRH